MKPRTQNSQTFLACLLLHMALPASAVPPTITFQPRDQIVAVNHAAAFDVFASGTGPLAYQWRKNDVPIPGATNDFIVIPQAQLSDAGLYSVAVSNAEASRTSTNVSLIVNPPVGGALDLTLPWGGVFLPWGGVLDGAVRSLAVQPDGRILIAGSFSHVNGAIRRRIARFNPDGATDYTFTNANPNGDIYSMAVQSDGKVVIGGLFSTINGVNRRQIARLNPDGSLDNTFLNGLSGANGSIKSVVLQNDGKVLVSGFFTTINDTLRSGIARLNPDGTLDTNFVATANNFVSSVALQADAKVVIGGQFTAINGAPRNGIARLNADGTLDGDFQNELLGADASVQSVALQRDGKVLLGGSFYHVNGVSRLRIARLNGDGTLDTSFSSPITHTASEIHSVVVQGDDTILIGGHSYSPLGGLFRLDTNGALLGISFTNRFSGFIDTVEVQSDGKLLVGGDFTGVNGVSRLGLARLNADGTVDDGFQNGLYGVNGRVFSVAVQTDGKLLIGGNFSSVNLVARNGIARFNADGTLDTGFQNGLSGANGPVNSVVLQSDGKILIGGGFTSVNGAARSVIARLNSDGATDFTFTNAFPTAAPYVYAVVVQSDGKVLIGGYRLIARLYADGTLDTNFVASVSATVYSIALADGGKVLIGGDFTTVNGLTRNRIARLNSDGSPDDFQEGRAGANGQVISVAVQGDGKVLLGGYFTGINNLPRISLARLNTNGTLDSGFQNGLSGTSAVGAIALQRDGKILIGGTWQTATGSRSLSRLQTDGTLDTSFLNSLSGPNFDVRAIALQSDGRVLIGGDFTTVNGLEAGYVARLWGNPQAIIQSLTRPAGGSALLTLLLPPGSTNRVQFKTNLNDAAWLELPGDVIASGSLGLTNKVDSTLGSAASRFYRVRQLP